MREVDRVFLHCSASDNPAHDSVAVIDRWHRERGFDEIGYHYFIKGDGTIEECRNLEKTPASQKGHNKGTISICVHGLTKFTQAQLDAVRRLCLGINAEYKVTFHGHCEVSAKSCPVFDYRKLLNLDETGRTV